MMEDRFIWKSDLGNGRYQNPILYADYSDPDVVRVEDDFYLIASSFNMSPGIPVLHSKDLVNWSIINHVTVDFPDSSYDRVRHGDGLWAPSLRYHDGWFWMFIGCPDEGIFMSKTKDPNGTWSPLHLVKKANGWIDPCPFWDEDGKAYLVHAFARSRIGFKHRLQVCEMAPDGESLLSEGEIIFFDEERHPTIEGPKMHKRNGFYYIFAPAGGVEFGWQTVLRSRSVWGPYEDKIVMEQGDSMTNGPHQGGWVTTEDEEDWFIHFQDKGPYGRVTHLQPMQWQDDWPVIGQLDPSTGRGVPVTEWQKPNVSSTVGITVPATSDDFSGGNLEKQWQWRGNQKQEWYTLKDDSLILFCRAQPLGVHDLYDTPQILTQKIPAPSCTFETVIDFHGEQPGDSFVFGMFGYQYSGLVVTKEAKETVLYLMNGDSDQSFPREKRERVCAMTNHEDLYFRLELKDGGECQLFFKERKDAQFEPIGSSFQAVKGHWVGAQIGIGSFHEQARKSDGFTRVHSFWIN
ncbi:family 43 glycosylhydrolase [Salipaludibacillus sp. CF4.18]|uniref:glycoside hydrolase family 43 protein n=1 Tax=Salipaludibacillus sp. CF4.18 TaxID=3373081 RepID=UPI003EE77A97